MQGNPRLGHGRERLLYVAAGVTDEARGRAELRGDADQALRLGALRDRALEEARYAENVAAGHPVVRRRKMPPGASIGWLFRWDAATRANRRALGLQVPDVPISSSITDAKALSA